MKFLWLLVLGIIGLAAWVRLAPSDATRWHVPVQGEADKDFKAGALRVFPGDPQVFAALDRIIRDTPRTKVLAGSTREGRITYVTRSLLWGFPDYTTIELRDENIAVLGRLRFGRSDTGVNKARIDSWLRALTSG
jgi:uncharacterized protein (DUF1499 family)